MSISGVTFLFKKLASISVRMHTGMCRLSQKENKETPVEIASRAKLGPARRAPSCQCLPFGAVGF